MSENETKQAVDWGTPSSTYWSLKQDLLLMNKTKAYI